MDDIKVMPKPDWVSWDDIHELLMAAHKRNIEKGMTMNTTTMSGEDLKKHLGEEGRCFVAFCGDQLVGTTSVAISIGKKWYDKGKVVSRARPRIQTSPCLRYFYLILAFMDSTINLELYFKIF